MRSGADLARRSPALTDKPVIYAANMSEDEFMGGIDSATAYLCTRCREIAAAEGS